MLCLSISVLPLDIFSLIISVIGSLHLLIVLLPACLLPAAWLLTAQKFSNDSHFLHPVQSIQSTWASIIHYLIWACWTSSSHNRQHQPGLCLGACRVWTSATFLDWGLTRSDWEKTMATVYLKAGLRKVQSRCLPACQPQGTPQESIQLNHLALLQLIYRI